MRFIKTPFWVEWRDSEKTLSLLKKKSQDYHLMFQVVEVEVTFETAFSYIKRK